uniref:hypothetical protein n=1 Tax=Nonomuraea sp. CA-252377 TaxID=3240003 RepID=UPI003F4965E2
MSDDGATTSVPQLTRRSDPSPPRSWVLPRTGAITFLAATRLNSRNATLLFPG